jgi:protein TonB
MNQGTRKIELLVIQVGALSLQTYFGTNPVVLDNRVFMLALSASVIAHATAFVTFKDVDLEKHQWQAPELAVEISLNFLPTQSRLSKPDNVKIPIKKSTEEELQSETKPVTESRDTNTSPATNAAASAPKVTDKSRRGEINDSKLVRDNYLSDVLTHIECYKYYPQAARRRNLRGAINISFLLLESGDIDELEVSGEALLLRRAAEHAVRRALPLPPPPKEISNPKRVSFVMHYRLR